MVKIFCKWMCSGSICVTYVSFVRENGFIYLTWTWMQIFLWFTYLILQNQMKMCSLYSGFHFFIAKMHEMFSSLFRTDSRQRMFKWFSSFSVSLWEKLTLYLSENLEPFCLGLHAVDFRHLLLECRKGKSNRFLLLSSL